MARDLDSIIQGTTPHRHHVWFLSKRKRETDKKGNEPNA